MSFKARSASLTIGKQILLLFVVPFLFPCVKASCFPKVLFFLLLRKYSAHNQSLRLHLLSTCQCPSPFSFTSEVWYCSGEETRVCNVLFTVCFNNTYPGLNTTLMPLYLNPEGRILKSRFFHHRFGDTFCSITLYFPFPVL